MLCTAVLGAGVLVVRTGSEEGSTAVGIDVAAGLPGLGAAPQPPGPAALTADQHAVSLAELAREARTRASTSTTRPRTTSTTTRRPAATTTTTARAASTTTTAARRPGAPAAAATTSTVANAVRVPTTLLEAIVPPAGAVSSGLTRSDSGVASWFRAPEGTCAHRTLPMGTSVKVTRVANGASATCKVDDRGPTKETGRLIDLSLDTFEKLASRDTGLIDVTIEW